MRSINPDHTGLKSLSLAGIAVWNILQANLYANLRAGIAVCGSISVPTSGKALQSGLFRGSISVPTSGQGLRPGLFCGSVSVPTSSQPGFSFTNNLKVAPNQSEATRQMIIMTQNYLKITTYNNRLSHLLPGFSPYLIRHILQN